MYQTRSTAAKSIQIKTLKGFRVEKFNIFHLKILIKTLFSGVKLVNKFKNQTVLYIWPPIGRLFSSFLFGNDST